MWISDAQLLPINLSLESTDLYSDKTRYLWISHTYYVVNIIVIENSSQDTVIFMKNTLQLIIWTRSSWTDIITLFLITPSGILASGLYCISNFILYNDDDRLFIVETKVVHCSRFTVQRLFLFLFYKIRCSCN